MSDSISGAVMSVLDWMAANPTGGVLLVVCLQVGLIAALAAVMAGGLSRRQAKLGHGFWLSAVVLALAVMPLHLMLGGWPVRVFTPVAAVADSASPPGSPPADSTVSQAAHEASRAAAAGRAPLEIDPADVSPADSARSALEPTAKLRPNGRPAWEQRINRTENELARGGEDLLRQSVTAQTSGSSLRRIAAVAFGGLYLAGCLVVLSRLVIGTLRLKRWSDRSRDLNAPAQSAVLQAAHDVGLPTAPAVRVVQEVAMPMVVGLLRPVVMVPGNFEAWTADEQRATLLHEMMHIRRRDMVGQLMAQWMRIIYWCHPASWYLDRRLMEAREWATDQAVVDIGMAAERYAESLLNIVSRVGCASQPACVRHNSSIAMSASGGIEARLKQLLQTAAERPTQQLLVGRCSVAVLVVLTALTTIRIEETVAQDNRANTPAAALPAPTEPAAASALDVADAAATDATNEAHVLPHPDESDLFARMRDCEVLDVSGDAFDAIFTVSGQVLSPHGIPVEGAIVLLRESSTQRISGAQEKYGWYRKDRHLLRTQDVFARTTTDRDGRFAFRDVKSPALPKYWRNAWRGDVVAAHQELGIGWLPLGPKQEIRRVDSDLTVVLRPTGSISGQFVSPEKRAIPQATVNLYQLVKPSTNMGENPDLDLQMSQLTPRVATDREGRFRITGVPEGFVAVVFMSHPDWFGGSAAIATSQEVSLGEQPSFGGWLGKDVVADPAEVIADPGQTIVGQVIDSAGQPVPDVSVLAAPSVQSVTTDADGRFRLRIASERVKHSAQGPTKLHVSMSRRLGLLGGYHEIRAGDLAAQTPVTIQLEKGTLVNGNVITEAGEPVPDAIVRSVSGHIGTTDADGKYELLLPRAQHRLVVGIDDPGYALPTRSELVAAGSAATPTSWPQQQVDLSDGVTKQVPPIVVSRTKPVTVIVSLPDGQPAVGATAIIRDELPMQSSANSRPSMPPRMIDKSDAVMTNELGRAELWPQGVPTEKAFVEVRLTTNAGGYDATVPLQRATDDVLNVVLQSAAILQGRVLLDGVPVSGATVSIAQSTPIRRTVSGGSTVMGSITSNQQRAVTNKDGWYRAAVAPDKEYSVSVLSLPGDSTRFGIGYRAAPTADGRLLVKDFAFQRGDHQIAGRVVDQQGNPVPKARVHILNTSTVSSHLWLGHQSESQSETDNLGRFELKNMPAGSYRLSVNGPRTESQSRGVSTMVMAEAGNQNVEVVLDPTPLPAIPRLQPRVIEPTQPAISQP